MNITVSPSFLKGEIEILPSKSYVQRYLFASALCDAQTEIKALTQAQDIRHTTSCLNALGADIKYSAGKFTVLPIQARHGRVHLDCGENGTLLRFIIPVASALGINCTIDGSDRLRQRPITDLLECLKQNGLAANDTYPLTLNGKLTAGDYRIKGNISSQFISALLFALPLLDGDSKIIITGELASINYVNMTLDVLQKFKVQILETDYGFFVKGNQKYISTGKITAEGDWSNAAFFLAAGAINGDITLKGLDIDSKQGDKEILNILNKCGANMQFNNQIIKVRKSNLKSCKVDAKHIPDLVPIVSVLAAYAQGETEIINVERLKDKESDRLSAILTMLKTLGIKCRSDGKTLVIQGGKLTGGTIDGVNDHRIVMSGAIAALNAESKITIADAQAIEKSYPTFFEEYIKLGGHAK